MIQPDLNKSRTVEGEAKRGAHNALAYLAESPSQEDIWDSILWAADEEGQHYDHPVGAAYPRAYRDVLGTALRGNRVHWSKWLFRLPNRVQFAR